MFSQQTYDVIRQRILDNIKVDIDKREGSFTSNMVSPLSVELAKTYLSMGDILALGFIETNFDEYLDKRVGEFGIYRKDGKKATGEIKVTGNDTFIEDGAILKAGDIHFLALNRLDLSVSDVLYVEAIEEGYKGNILANTEFELVEKNPKVSKLVNESNFTGGIDIETDEELRKRFVKLVNNPSTSGNKAHYEQWALEVQGVGSARIHPLWDGNGTVKVVVIGNDSRPVDESIIEETRKHITVNMPIGPTLTVATPTVFNVDIIANVEVSEGFEIADVKTEFETILADYTKDVSSELVYSKVYGLLANMISVEDISLLTVNGSNTNINIPADKIITSSITMSEVV